MSKTMAEVLAEHQLCAAWENDESRIIFCMCGLELPAAKDDVGIDLTFLAAHQAAALSAAGFGLVADAKAEALEEAAEEAPKRRDYARSTEECADWKVWLRDRADSIRNPSGAGQ